MIRGNGQLDGIGYERGGRLRSSRECPKIEPMPFYRFMIHGRDPRLPPEVRGFFTTRHAYGATREKAARKVLSRLEREFTVGASASIWSSDAPIMSIEESWQIGVFQLGSAPNKGSTFYEP
mgnify:CR=1 FL=1